MLIRQILSPTRPMHVLELRLIDVRTDFPLALTNLISFGTYLMCAGTGKTHSMLGAGMETGLRSGRIDGAPTPHWGLLPRAVHQLFSRLDMESDGGPADR